jgi:hypothetical protein
MSNKSNDDEYKELPDAEMDTQDQHEEEIDYEVGYKRPPVQSRFQTGQSGNPKGRPRGRKNLKTIVNEVAWTPITVKNNGVPVKMSLVEANVRQLANAGASKASKHALDFIALVDRNTDVDEVSAEPTQREEQYMSRIIARLKRQLKEEDDK